MSKVLPIVKPVLDSHQFAYSANRCTDDAIATLVHYIQQHLDRDCRNYVRSLFIDYSSAFNTIQPHIMTDILLQYNVPAAYCLWILDFLTERCQYVKANNRISNKIVINTGAPQGCVLSAVLFILYTNSLTKNTSSCKIIKYADDTVVLGLVSNNDETPYKECISYVEKWCTDHYLQLNVKKTKEIIFDFRKKKMSQNASPITIKDDSVEIVNNYKYLGCIIDSNLKWDDHVLNQVKKVNKRMYHLNFLKKFNVDCNIVALFYNSVISSVISYGMSCWFPGITDKNKKLLDKPRKRGVRLTESNLKSHQEICNDQVKAFTSKVLKD